MKRLCVLLCALFGALALGAGCASEDGQSPFAAAIKDWNGDNMQMRGFGDQPAKPIRPGY
jgi:hypothetical protein